MSFAEKQAREGLKNRLGSHQQSALTVLGCFILCFAGGWFGSQLFPPVLEFKSRRLGSATTP